MISNGTIYEGTLEDRAFSGWARIIKPNGDVYIGAVKQSLPDGIGKYSRANGKVSQGYFSKGEYFESEYLYKLNSLFKEKPKYKSLKPEVVALWERVGNF